jgi:hypothetical protein
MADMRVKSVTHWYNFSGVTMSNSSPRREMREALQDVVKAEMASFREAVERETKDTRQYVEQGIRGIKESFEGVKQSIERDTNRTEGQFREISTKMDNYIKDINGVKVENSSIKASANTVYLVLVMLVPFLGVTYAYIRQADAKQLEVYDQRISSSEKQADLRVAGLERKVDYVGDLIQKTIVRPASQQAGRRSRGGTRNRHPHWD